MARVRQGIKKVAKIKNKNAKYKVKYTLAQGIKVKGKTAKKYSYKSKTINKKGKYTYKY